MVPAIAMIIPAAAIQFPFLAVEGFDNIYALGDLAYMETPLYPKGHPQVANVAIANTKLYVNYKEGFIGTSLKKIACT